MVHHHIIHVSERCSLASTSIPPISYRQLGVRPATCQNLQSALDIRPNHGNVTRKLPNGNQEIAKQDEQSVQLDQEPGQRPAEEDQDDAGGEGGGALEFLGAGEEGDGFLDADDKG